MCKQWHDRIAYKYEHKMYHHQQTLDKWKEIEAQRGKSILKTNVVDYLKKEVSNELSVEKSIRRKFKKGKKLSYDELTAKNVQKLLPHIDQRYLMNNDTCKLSDRDIIARQHAMEKARRHLKKPV